MFSFSSDEEDIDAAIKDLSIKTSKMTLNQTNIQKEKPPNTSTNLLPNNPHQHKDNTPCFTPFYVNVFEDIASQKPSKKTVPSAHEKALIEQYQQQEGVDIKEIVSAHRSLAGTSAEDYEKTAVAHGDYGFHKFLKYLQSCPEQCIR